MCAVKAGTSTPCGSTPGQRQKLGTRVPPRYGVPLLPRIESLLIAAPVAVPLSVVKTTSVFSASPHSSSLSSSRPMLVSIFSIIP